MPRGVNADDAQSFGAGRRFSEEIIKISTSTRRQKNKNYYRGGRPRDASRRELGINPPAFVFLVHNDPRGGVRSRLTGFGVKTVQTNEDLKF
jgi:hypothetical protein